MSDTPQSVPFRSASPSPAVPTRTDTSTTSKVDSPQFRAGSIDDSGPTPYVYQELEGKPYAVKYLDIDLYHDDKDFPEVKEQASQLDKFVIKQAKALGLKDSKDSYKEVVEAIYKKIGKSPNEDPVKALRRLSVAASAIERLESAKLQPILSAKTLTPKEYEELQP